MRTRTTLSLAVVAASFVTYIWFVERHTLSTQEKADTAARVINIEPGKITSIFIQNAGSPIELHKKDGVWRLKHPIEDRADDLVVSQLLSTLESLQHNSKIDVPAAQEKDRLKEFGVADSELRIKVRTESGKEAELLLGKDSAIEGKQYIRQQGANTVFVINGNLRSQLAKKPEEFRDKRLSDIQLQQVHRLGIKTPDGELELERKSSHWEIVKPLRARAADQKVNDLLASILTAKVAQFYPETPTPEQGLGEPRATISIHVEGDKEPITLKIGSAPLGEVNKDHSFARLLNRPAVTVLSNLALDPLLKARPNDVRDRKLVRVESDIVDRITIESVRRPKIVLIRKGEGWIQKEGDKEVRINEAIPPRLLANIQSAEVTNFVSDVASDLAKYGLEHPQMKVTFSSYASENTAETHAGERPILAICFGNVEGDTGYAKIEDEPFILATPRNLLQSLPYHSAQLQPLGILKIKPETVSSLEIMAEGSALKLEKKESGWKFATDARAVPDEAAVRAILGTLCTLHTSRWLAPEESGEQGADQATTTFNITINAADKNSTVTLTIGRPLGNEGFYSKLSTNEGTFLLSTADHTTLSRRLTK